MADDIKGKDAEQHAGGTEKHPYYKLDSGSPHTKPEDYRKLGLGEFAPDQRYADMHGEPDASDNSLRERLAQTLAAHRELARIDIDVIHGVVRLHGFVENRYDRERAESLITGTEGVNSVHNDVKVQRTEASEGGPVLTTRERGANKTGTTQRS